VAHAIAAEKGLTFDVAAGHSLGEYSALVACGVLSFEDGLVAVKNRARLMQEACDANPGTMTAVVGLDYETVTEICRRASAAGVVVAANYNSANQVAISGDQAGIDKASELAKDAGAKRVIPLAVGGAFHSPLMKPSPEKLTPVLEGLMFKAAEIPVILNVTAKPTIDPAEIKTRLIEQLTAPVLWYPTLTQMRSMGAETLIEVGPKKVLCGLAKSVFKGMPLLSLDTAADFDSVLAECSANANN
jgi:[acyl-carrier-protein] S-malonyltransferase